MIQERQKKKGKFVYGMCKKYEQVNETWDIFKIYFLYSSPSVFISVRS